MSGKWQTFLHERSTEDNNHQIADEVLEIRQECKGKKHKHMTRYSCEYNAENLKKAAEGEVEKKENIIRTLNKDLTKATRAAVSKVQKANGEVNKQEENRKKIIKSLDEDLFKASSALRKSMEEFRHADLEEKIVKHGIPSDVAVSAKRLYDDGVADKDQRPEYMNRLYVKPEKRGGKTTWFWLGFIPYPIPAIWVQGDIATSQLLSLGGNYEEDFDNLEALKKHLGDTSKSTGDLESTGDLGVDGDKVALKAGYIKLICLPPKIHKCTLWNVDRIL